MGCTTSKPIDDNEDARRQIARQRRRLSMAPEKVGDIKGIDGSTDSEPKQQGKIDGVDQSPVEDPSEPTVTTKAEGAIIHDPASHDPNTPADSALARHPDDDDGATEKRQKYLRIAHHTKKGYVPYNIDKVNQDRYVVKHTLQSDPGLSVFGVFDGHGEYGHLVAEFVKTNLPLYLEQLPLRDNPPECICYAIQRISSALQETHITIAFSGTTAVFALKVDDTLYVANIGDSRCVLARYAHDETSVLEAVPLSNDHKPNVPSEKARILAAGGRVCPLPPQGDTPEDGDTGPDRVWLADYDIPGLAMTRSIGDEVSQRVGVISVPEIISYTIKSNDLFAIFASDGVWEFVSNERAVLEVYSRLPSLSDGTRALIQLSTQMWHENEQVVDDITVIVAQFNFDGFDSTTA